MSVDFDYKAQITIPNMEELGGPDGWQWREPQQELVERIVNTDKKVVLLQAEPGIGKTSVAWGLTKAALGRCCVLVHTRQLQRQYTRDFEDLKLLEGRSHYGCKVTGTLAEGAPCAYGVKCEHKGVKYFKNWVQKPDCEYYLAKMEAEENKASILNYAYWLTETKTRPNLSMFTGLDWIVCDEAHDLQAVLMQFDEVTFNQRELYKMDLKRVPNTDNFYELADWKVENLRTSLYRHNDLVAKLQDAGLPIEYYGGEDSPEGSISEGFVFTDEIVKDLGEVRQLTDMLNRLYDAPLQNEEALDNYWVIDRERDKNEVSFRPLYGYRGMNRLQAASEKLLLMSAFLAPKMLMPNLGLKEEDCEVIEAPPMYDRRKSLFVSLPVTRMSFKTPDYEWRQTTQVIDEIIDLHADESGIVIVPSVRLRDTIMRHTKYPEKFITYEGNYKRAFGEHTKDSAIAELIKVGRKEQKILLGQSISTGVDLPHVIGFSIVVKLAFPPMQDLALSKRMEHDKFFQPYMIICTLVQSAGRSKRAHDHECVTYILDGHFINFWGRYKQFFPEWFNKYLVDGRKLMPNMVRTLVSKGVRLL